MRLPERYFPVFILLLCAIIFLPHLGILPVNIMEARNFISAREMLFDQNWILTTLNDEPRYEKPPLPTWLTAASGALFGLDNVGALRLPAVLMAFVLAFFTYRFANKITGHKKYALLSVMILVTSFYILWAGRNGQWDIFTHGFMMVAIYQFFLLFTERRKNYQHAILAGIFLGFSFMSKGPVSLYALFLPFLIAFGWVYKFGRQIKNNRQYHLGPLVVLIIVAAVLSAWWHLYIYFMDTKAALEITTEEVANWNSYNVRPFYYYWNFFIQSGTWTIVAAIGLLYPYLKNRVFSRKAYKFTIIWTLASVLLLSIIPEKKPRYLLPVLIPLAMNTGFYIEYLIRAGRERRLKSWEKIPVWIQFGLIGVVGIILPFGGYWYLGDQLDGYWLWFLSFSISTFITGIFILLALRKNRIDRAFYLTIAFMSALVLFGLPLSDSIADNPQYNSLSHLRQWQDSTGLPAYEFQEASPELVWDYGKPIPVLYDHDKYATPSESSFGLLAYEKLEEEVMSHFKDFHIEKIGHFDLNSRGKEQGGHNGRLYRDFYLISRK